VHSATRPGLSISAGRDGPANAADTAGTTEKAGPMHRLTLSTATVATAHTLWARRDGHTVTIHDLDGAAITGAHRRTWERSLDTLAEVGAITAPRLRRGVAGPRTITLHADHWVWQALGLAEVAA
jgi:hypothetical protein